MSSTISPTLKPRCAHCGNTSTLQRCSKCKVQLYCIRDHQVIDRESHKAACNSIAKKSAIMDSEEQKLRSHPGDWVMPANPFQSSVGHFWGLHGTRDYMRARFALVEALQKVKTRSSVEAQRDHLMDMLRLCRGDNMGVRYLVPSLMIWLGQDQEAYDFAKWWVVDAQGHDWGNLALPYLNVNDADVFEAVDYLCRRFAQVNFSVPVTLLKVKLLLDLKDLQDAANEHSTAINPSKLRSSIIAGNSELMACSDHNDLIQTLIAQVKKLYDTVQSENEHFWPALQNPGGHLTARPMGYSKGSEQEMQITLMYTYTAWVETPGAIEYVGQLS